MTTTKKTAKQIILDLIGKGKTDDQIIAATKKALPDSLVDSKHCTKYRKIYAVTDGAKNSEMYSAFGSGEHQAWGNEAGNEKTRISAKCPHAKMWKERIARHKTAVASANKAKAEAKKKAVAQKKAA